MEQTYEKDGIIYFEKPFRTDLVDWAYDHLDYDSVYREDENFSKVVFIICYAKSKEYNEKLYEIKKRLYNDDILMRGVSAEEVGAIV